VNFARLGVAAPFHTPFPQLVREWQNKAKDILEGVCKIEGEPQEVHKASADDGSSKVSVHVQETDCPKSSTTGHVLRCKKLLRTLQETTQAGQPRKSHYGRNQKLPRKGGHGQETSQFSSCSKLSTLLQEPQCKGLVLKHLNSLVPISLSCLQRGVPLPRAMICLPSEEDLNQLGKDSTFGGPLEKLHPKCGHEKKEKKSVRKTKKSTKSSSVTCGKGSAAAVEASKTEATEASKVESCPKRETKGALNAKQLGEKLELMKEPKAILGTSDRPIIGFLTDGDFDLGQGHGSGIGFCSMVGLLAVLKSAVVNRPLLVLVRNPTSRQYRFANLSVIV
jgi:hypothetical protein